MDSSDEIPIDVVSKRLPSDHSPTTHQDRPKRKVTDLFPNKNHQSAPPTIVSPDDDPATGNAKNEIKPLTQLGSYRIRAKIGSGGFGDVYTCEDPVHGRLVAIKVLHSKDPVIRKRFDREAKAIGRCAHPNIVTIYKYDTQGPDPYLVMEHLKGRAPANFPPICLVPGRA